MQVIKPMVQNWTKPGIASVRFLHLSPIPSSVDLYSNGALLSEGLSYKQLTQYLPLQEGQYRIDLYEFGLTDRPLYSAVIPFINGQSYTIAITTGRQSLQFVPTFDDTYVPHDEVTFRFMHLATNIQTIDVAVAGGDVLFSNLSYNEISDYMPLVPMKVNLEIRTAGTRDVVLSIPRTTFLANQHYTIYIVDTHTETTQVEAILIPC
jgi:Domain of unknown function (DUF4397)